MTRTVLLCLLSALLQGGSPASRGDARYFSGLRWRLIGPNRAGRAWVVAGVLYVFTVPLLRAARPPAADALRLN